MIAITKTKKRVRLVNPQGKTRKRRTNSAGKRGKRSTHRKTNPGELITLGVVNPQQKGTTVSTKKRRVNGKRKAARRKNPVTIIRAASPKKRKANGKHRRRRNPSLMTSGKQLIESGAFALAGLVVARQVPQMLLKTSNSGWKGYAANAAAAIAASYAAAKFAGPKAAEDVLVGGGLYLVNRVLSEQFSPIGKALSLSGIGDAQAAASLHGIKPGYFPLPVQRDSKGNPIIPSAIVDAVRAQLPPTPAASKVSGVARAMAGRF